MTFAEAAEALRSGFAERAAAALHELLERKHLYQSVRAQLDETFIFECAAQAPTERRSWFLAVGEMLKDGPWDLSPFGPGGSGGNSVGQIGGGDIRRLQVRAPDVKLYCKMPGCRRQEPFNMVGCTDMLGGEYSLARPVRQIFGLSCVCQSCKGEPTIFLVRREGLKLTLVGRSSIEHVEVPTVIPRSVEHFYSGAVVAHQSGQTLAGNFMLRTLVEQWVRSFPSTAAMRVEDALDWYYSKLPEAFKQHSPSLREIYEHLSSDIHAAKGDESVFTSEMARIVEHFDGWRFYKLDGATFGQTPDGDGAAAPRGG